MNGYDGPTLRSVRESAGVALRQVARQANMSHGHLSKVERGEPGRPVTPAVLAAYEKATGIRLTGLAGHRPVDPSQTGGWRPGYLSETRRRTLNAKIAAVAVGGPLSEQLNRILDATGRPIIPDRIEDPDVIQVERVAALCTSVDLLYGGGVADQMARALLRWAVGLLEAAPTGSPITTRLHAAIGALAQRAGWAAFDAYTHDVARSLFTVALYAATRANNPDLRAHVIADFAAQHNYLGYPDDCLQVVRFGEVDERIFPAGADGHARSQGPRLRDAGRRRRLWPPDRAR
ncbi:MAG TPA: helix-turn-helix transcriptional regulator [Natronosporangium sp.]